MTIKQDFAVRLTNISSNYVLTITSSEKYLEVILNNSLVVKDL